MERYSLWKDTLEQHDVVYEQEVYYSIYSDVEALTNAVRKSKNGERESGNDDNGRDEWASLYATIGPLERPEKLRKSDEEAS